MRQYKAFFMFCSIQCTCLHVHWVKAQQECIFTFGYFVWGFTSQSTIIQPCQLTVHPILGYLGEKGGGGMSSHCFLEGANIHHYAFVEGAIILPCQLLVGQMSTHAIFHMSGGGGGGGGEMSGSRKCGMFYIRLVSQFFSYYQIRQWLVKHLNHHTFCHLLLSWKCFIVWIELQPDLCNDYWSFFIASDTQWAYFRVFLPRFWLVLFYLHFCERILVIC